MAASTRDMVCRLAPTDPEGAARLARSIEVPWFRSQALAWAARFAADDRIESLVEEALYASYSESDPYRIVATGAWSLRALVERGRNTTAQRILEDLLSLAPGVEPPASRAGALFLIWQAIFPLGPEARSKALDVFLTTCRAEDSWRVARIFQEIAWMLSTLDKEAAESIVAAMPEGRWKRQAERRVESGQAPHPRQFFWSAA